MDYSLALQDVLHKQSNIESLKLFSFPQFSHELKLLAFLVSFFFFFFDRYLAFLVSSECTAIIWCKKKLSLFKNPKL